MELQDDRRNVQDEFKGMDIPEIRRTLDTRGVELEVAIENLTRDFNMGTIVRSANAFGVRRVHVIGRRQWNKRGAMMTDKYLEVIYHHNIEVFVEHIGEKELIAIENAGETASLAGFKFAPNSVLVFGSEGQGVSPELLSQCKTTVAIEQFGSTRSLNVGVASGIAMYEWLRQIKLQHPNR